MLLTITTTHKPATDLGYLVHKNPYRCQQTELSFGSLDIFFPEATKDRCTLALLLDVDPIGLVRGKNSARTSVPLEQYVNDRPYVCSSFLSVALSRAFGQALQGRCKERPELVETMMPLTVNMSVLPCRGGEEFLKRLFEPLGYSLAATRHPLDVEFPDWGDSPYYTVELCKETTVKELLNHLYVLIPVLDNQKHYYVGKNEIDKLMRRGEGWLATHPEREGITRRYLKYQSSYAREALARLMEINPAEDELFDEAKAQPEDRMEERLKLNEERLGTVLSALKASGAEKVLDLGCGGGKLLQILLKEKQFTRIVGLDVSFKVLEIASDRLHLAEMPAKQRERIELLHGSLIYRDRRLENYDAAAVVEVVEHLDKARLKAFERVLFEFAKPTTVVLTTPNREYNRMWEAVGPDKLRHQDHRFEWTRSEFREWAEGVARQHGYAAKFLPVGPMDEELGAPTQMCIFSLNQ
jgi:3' terminal RNA ribose 2'-O-methyltransferase Hen1